MLGGVRLAPWGLFGATILAALFWLACNGNGGGQESTAVPGPSASALCQPLADAESFRYEFGYEMESLKPEGPIDTSAVGDPPFALAPDADDFTFFQEVEGSIISPDSADIVSRSSISAIDLPQIFIGNLQWVNLGDIWIESTGSQPMPFPPLSVCDAVLGDLDLGGIAASEEEIDGTDALRYRVEEVELDAAQLLFGAQSGDIGRLLTTYRVDVWLSADDDLPLRIEASSVGTYPSGRELTIDLTLSVKDVNDGDIVVAPPDIAPPLQP